MYGCAYAVKNRAIAITYVETGLFQEFAISVRVLEWANSQYGLILFPQSVTDPYPATRQNPPITFRIPPLHVFTVVLIAPEKLTNRTYPDVTLESLFFSNYGDQVPSDAYRIPLFVGSDPGMSTNTLHSSLVVSPRQHLHCSAVTIISQYEEWVISLALFFNWQERLETLAGKFREQVLTSPKYPWIFDEVEDVDFASVTGIEMAGGYASMDLELMSIEGGTLYLQMAGRAGNKTKILTSKDLGHEFQSTAHVVSARFQPDANYTGPRGFLLSVKSIERQIELNSCVRNITLTKADPVFAINQVQYQTGQYVCVKLDETNETQQQLVATYCNLKSKNNHVKEHRIDDCIYYDVDLVYLTQTCCRMTMNITRIDYTKIRIDIEYSSLLIQLSDSILEDVNYLPIGIQPFSSNFQTMSLSANAEKDTLVFLIFCYSYTNWGLLEQLRRAHSDQDCEYNLYAGAIPNGDDKLPLATYHESEQFYPQFLPSGVYSSYIPKGCNPTIAVNVIQLNTDPGALIEQCKGIAMDVGHGFGDRLHEFNVDVNSTKIWECESRIDVEYELKALNMGSLEILALDADSQIIARECFEADNLPELPKNTTFRGVYKLKVNWEGGGPVYIGEATGYLGTAYFLPSKRTTTALPKLTTNRDETSITRKLTNQTVPDLMLSAAFDRDLEGEGLSDAYRIPLYIGADPGISNKNLLLASRGQLICPKIGDNVADHENAIIATLCNLKQKNDPDSETPIEGCIYYNLDLTYSKQICCRMVLNASKNEYTQIRLNNEYSSLLVQLPHSIAGYDDHIQVPTNQCKGMALDVGPAFGDPFHDHFEATNTSKLWECERFINFQYELKALNLGTLEISAMDGTFQMLDRSL
ncbi:unnamed protein product, partial [Mesorhabditis spiculigera]